MSTIDLLIDLHRRGVRVRPNGDNLKFNAPVGVMTPEIRATLAEHKPQIIELLTLPCPSCGKPAQVEYGDGWTHRWCSGHYDVWEREMGRRWRDLDPCISDIFRAALRSEAIQ